MAKDIRFRDKKELDLLYFRGQCENSYLQSKGDIKHDIDRQRNVSNCKWHSKWGHLTSNLGEDTYISNQLNLFDL